jgi:DNA-directed RNA polymerase subunit L
MHLRQIIYQGEVVQLQVVPPLKYRKSHPNLQMSHISMITIQTRSQYQVTQRMLRESRSVLHSCKEI